MTHVWTVVCPRCHQASRYTAVTRDDRPPPVNGTFYRGEENRDVCGDCRNGRSETPRD